MEPVLQKVVRVGPSGVKRKVTKGLLSFTDLYIQFSQLFSKIT